MAQSRGCARSETGDFECTLYTSCCNTDLGLYYYTTYENRQISCVSLQGEPLDGSRLITYPMLREQRIFRQNRSSEPALKNI